MDNALASLTLPDNQPLVKVEENDLLAMTSAGGFLPRLGIAGSSSKAFQEQQAQLGSFTLTADKEARDLGRQIDVLLCSVRTKALKIADKEIVECYDRNTDTFRQIQKESEGKDSGCQWGAEFLVWIPSEATFATYFLGSKTGRRESPNLLAIMKDGAETFQIKPATMETKLITGGKYKWHGSISRKCTVPLDPIPANDDFQPVLQKFLNPPARKVEPAEADNRAR